MVRTRGFLVLFLKIFCFKLNTMGFKPKKMGFEQNKMGFKLKTWDIKLPTSLEFCKVLRILFLLRKNTYWGLSRDFSWISRLYYLHEKSLERPQ